MPKAKRGELWLADLGLAAKVRPVLILSVDYRDNERAVVTYVSRTTAVRGTAYELPHQSSGMPAGTFDAQGIGNVLRWTTLWPHCYAPRYDLAGHNCWNYATRIADRAAAGAEEGSREVDGARPAAGSQARIIHGGSGYASRRFQPRIRHRWHAL